VPSRAVDGSGIAVMVTKLVPVPPFKPEENLYKTMDFIPGFASLVNFGWKRVSSQWFQYFGASVSEFMAMYLFSGRDLLVVWPMIRKGRETYYYIEGVRWGVM
jgi:hypothetical protein